jgi:hypothetical protein
MINFPFDSIKNPKLKYFSVTKWLSEDEEPFDAMAIASKVCTYKGSEYFGMDPNTIVKLWDLTGKRGSDKHQEIENWLRGVNPTCEFKKEFEQLGITPDTSWSEIKLYSDWLCLSGIIDIIQGGNKSYIVHDIKTFKKMTEDKLIKTIVDFIGLVFIIMPFSTYPCGIKHDD